MRAAAARAAEDVEDGEGAEGEAAADPATAARAEEPQGELRRDGPGDRARVAAAGAGDERGFARTNFSGGLKGFRVRGGMLGPWVRRAKRR